MGRTLGAPAAVLVLAFVLAVRVAAGGTAVRPTRLACSGSVGATQVKGVPRATSGAASCRFRTPASGKRKTLRGAIAFTARGTRFTKRFSAKLG